MKLPRKVMWRWSERNYRRRYGHWTHGASPHGTQTGAYVLHLGPVKVLFE